MDTPLQLLTPPAQRSRWKSMTYWDIVKVIQNFPNIPLQSTSYWKVIHIQLLGESFEQLRRLLSLSNFLRSDKHMVFTLGKRRETDGFGGSSIVRDTVICGPTMMLTDEFNMIWPYEWRQHGPLQDVAPCCTSLRLKDHWHDKSPSCLELCCVQKSDQRFSSLRGWATGLN